MIPAVRSALLSGCSAGVGLWCYQAALDIVSTPRGPVRVALLPPLWMLAACVVAGALAALLAAVVLTRITDSAASARTPPAPVVSGAAADVLRPLHALWILALPYLPWLPDAAPILRVAAGPAGATFVGLLGMQVVVLGGSLFVRHRRARAPRGTGSRRMALAAVFTISVLGPALAASRLADTSLFPSGDEPHYLVIAQSLWRDGDLRIENNHARGDYREYFARDLAPHYVTRGTDQQIYSIHPIGLGVVLAPVYAFGGYVATVAVQLLMAAMAITLAWWWSARRTGSSSAATWAWAAIALSTPWVINAFTIYPEIGGALLGMAAFVSVTSWPRRGTHIAPWLVAGVSVALLPWFSTKYAPMSAALLVVALARAWFDDEEAHATPWRASLALVVPYAVSLAGWFLFFNVIWGTFSPSAPYGSDNQTNPIHLRTGAPGLLFDQEYGLLAFTPGVIFAFTGLIGMWREGRALRRQALEILVVAGALFATVGAFRIWWGGSAGPGRPVIAALALMALPMAWTFAHARTALQRAGHRLLVMAGIVVAVTVVVAQRGLLFAAGRDGTSNLLQWWSPAWHLTEMAPSFIAHYPQEAILFVLVWLVVAVGVGAWLARRRHDDGRDQAGRASLIAMSVTFTAIVVITLVIESTLSAAQQATASADERSRSVLLDRFDAVRRPWAVRYSPLEGVAPREALPWIRLGTDRPLPRSGLSVPLALNARVSLPAGRYRVRTRALPTLRAPVTGNLGIQVGRAFEALDAWGVTLTAGGAWSKEFTIDVDANFVGLRAEPEMSRALGEVWFEPIAPIDAHARAGVGEVLAARRYGTTTVYFHDEEAWPEPAGFWTRGRDEARFTAATSPAGRVTMRIRNGPVANHVWVDIGGRPVEFDVEANSFHEVPVELGARPIRISVRTRDGFVPAEFDRASRDRRRLGAWIEMTR